MAYRHDLRVPFLYGTATITLRDLRFHMIAEDQDPEYVERFIAWLDWCGGLIGYGGGTRDVQPDKPGFAPDGKSFHLRQLYASGVKRSSAVDVVRLNPTGGKHLTVRWSDVPVQGSDQARVWGVHANVDQGTNPEAWHIQPIERDGWQTWVDAGRPGLRANYPFPGRGGVTPPPPPPPPPPLTTGTYTVKSGDSWWSISQRYGITVSQLLALNPPATSATIIHPGDVLKVPKANTYTVVSGDSWWGISRKYGITVDQLVALNPPATSSTVIHPGQVLNVPGTGDDPYDWVSAGAQMTTPPANPILKRGVQHGNVMWLQAVLCSMPTLPADGGQSIYNPAWVGRDRIDDGPADNDLFGDATHNALVYWQSKNGLTADGVYGSATANKMLAVRGK